MFLVKGLARFLIGSLVDYCILGVLYRSYKAFVGYVVWQYFFPVQPVFLYSSVFGGEKRKSNFEKVFLL